MMTKKQQPPSIITLATTLLLVLLSNLAAAYFNIDSPIPNAFRNETNIQNGINFAHGGIGVFDTYIDGPNLNTQIDTFELLIEQQLFTNEDLQNCYVLVNVGANDYITNIRNLSFFDVPNFTATLVNQTKTDLTRFQRLGVGKVAVGLLPPVGCLPIITSVYFYSGRCIEFFNQVSENHNKLLKDAIEHINVESHVGNTTYVTLDLYTAFLTPIDLMMKKAQQENSNSTNAIENPLLVECCVPNPGYEYGSVDAEGTHLYEGCDHPNVSFFWDMVNPSDAGWNAIFHLLKPSIAQLTQQ